MERHIFTTAILLTIFAAGCGDSGDKIDYAALGASDATGVGAVAPLKGYVFEIEDGLDVEDSCDGADLKNLGIPGAKAGDIENAALPVAKELDPDLVTLWTGPNDLVGGDSVEKFEESLEKIVKEITEETQATLFIANIPDITQLPRFVDDPDQDVTPERIQAFNAAISRQADKYGAVMVDLFSSLQFEEVLVSDDGFHPSNEGHQRIARLFLDQIIPRICNPNQNS